MSNVSFPYAVSVVKVHEDSLISQSGWNRLFEADLKGAYKLLHDMGYGHTAQDPDDIDSLTRANVGEAKALIRDLSPMPELTGLLLLQTDAHNIKCVLKGMLEGEEVENLLIDGGSIPVDELLDAFERDRFESFPVMFREAVEAFSPDMTPMEISSLIDDAAFRQAEYVLREGRGLERIRMKLSDKERFVRQLRRYFDAKTDFTNVMTTLRVKKLGWGEEKLLSLLVPGGTIETSAFRDALSLPGAETASALAKGEEASFIREKLEQGDNLPDLDQAFSRRLFDIVHENYSEPLGLGPLINYVIQKEFEARALRLLFQAKRSGREITQAQLGVVL